MSETKSTIMYVEDDRMSCVVLSMILKNRTDIETLHIFEDSHNFTEKVQALDPKPDIIFLDIHVPPIDGFQMLEILRSMPDYNEIPIIALTASVMNEEIQKLTTAGFSGCVAKPIDADVFATVFEDIRAGKPVWNIVNF